MSGSAPAPTKVEAQAGAAREAYIDLAEKIYINLAARVYGTLSGTEQKKPDPKALAAFCFKLANAFEEATRETDRMQSRIEAENKAAVKLDQIDVSSFIGAGKK
jgi:hypothetical protein